MDWGYGLLVFGLINLIMAIVVNPLLRKEVTKPWCGDEISDVKSNKIHIKIYFAFSIICTLVGLGMILL